jgi:glycosyltransferase involved in cell wall biosynthesis
VPAILSDIPVLREVVGDAAIFFDPRDKERAAEAIVSLLTDEGLKRSLAEKGLKRAKEFSWEKCAKATLDLIRKVGTVS